MILLRSILNFGHPIENPVTTAWGAGDVSKQDETPIPTLCVITVDIYFFLSFLVITLKWFSFVCDLSFHTLHVILTASIIRSCFNINTYNYYPVLLYCMTNAHTKNTSIHFFTYLLCFRFWILLHYYYFP